MNWEIPEALKWDEFRQKIIELTHFTTIFCSKCKEGGHGNSKKQPMIIFVEGFLLFEPNRVEDLLSHKLYLVVDKEICRKRRAATYLDHPKYFDEVLWPTFIKHNKHILDDLGIFLLDGTKALDQVMEDAFIFLEGKSECLDTQARAKFKGLLVKFSTE